MTFPTKLWHTIHLENDAQKLGKRLQPATGYLETRANVPTCYGPIVLSFAVNLMADEVRQKGSTR